MPSPLAAFAKRLPLLLALAVLSGCFRAPLQNRDEEALADFLGSFSDQNGCKSLMVEVSNPSIRCYEGLYKTIVGGRILVDGDTDCILTSSDVPDWAWGAKYDFEILGIRGKRTWIYEPFSKRTFIMEDGKLLRFCPGRVLPNEDQPPCTCTPIPAVRMQRRLERHREGQGTGKISTSKSSAHSRKAVGGSSLAPGFRDTPPPTSEPR